MIQASSRDSKEAAPVRATNPDPRDQRPCDQEAPLTTAPRDRRILVTLPDVAWPIDGGKRLRANGVLRGLTAAGRVDVAFLFSSSASGQPPVPPDVTVNDWMQVDPAPHAKLTGAAHALARRLPVQVGAQRWDAVRERLAAWGDRRYDLIWFGGLDHAWALHGALTARRRIVDCDDVETAKWRSFLDAGSGGRWEQAQRRLELPMWRRIQSDVAGWADVVAVCSDLDASRFGRGRTVVIPNTYPEPPAWVADQHNGSVSVPPRLTMIANWGTDQNVDAARHAVHDVLPPVRHRLPTARLRLVGRRSERIAELAGIEGVDLVGEVDDVTSELAATAVVIVPMRFGGGTRLKILEAFAHGKPVVSTSLGAEGLRVEDGIHLLVRNDPIAFAAAVHDIVTDSGLRDRLVIAGRSLYLSSFRPVAAIDAVSATVDSLFL